MKIAFISTLSHVSWGGSEALWHKTALYAAEQNAEVYALVYKWEKESQKITELKQKNVQIGYRNRFEVENNIIKRIINFIKSNLRKPDFEFKKLVKFNPDFICISQASTFDTAEKVNIGLQLFLNKVNKPYVIICQNNADIGYVPGADAREKMRTYFTNAKKVLFSSKRNHEVAERQLIKKFSNVYYTGNPLTINEISIKPYPTSETICFAVVAALKISHKGQDILLEALSSEKWKARNWLLNLYGKGEDEAYLKELVKYYELDNRVRFCGYTSEMDKLWLENHIYVLPTLGEGLPITLCDAVLSGRAAVVTDVGGNAELIIDNETGFLCPAPTVKLFDETLERAWQHKDEWKMMGEKAFSLAKERIDVTPEKTLLNLLIQ